MRGVQAEAEPSGLVELTRRHLPAILELWLPIWAFRMLSGQPQLQDRVESAAVLVLPWVAAPLRTVIHRCEGRHPQAVEGAISLSAYSFGWGNSHGACEVG